MTKRQKQRLRGKKKAAQTMALCLRIKRYPKADPVRLAAVKAAAQAPRLSPVMQLLREGAFYPLREDEEEAWERAA